MSTVAEALALLQRSKAAAASSLRQAKAAALAQLSQAQHRLSPRHTPSGERAVFWNLERALQCSRSQPPAPPACRRRPRWRCDRRSPAAPPPLPTLGPQARAAATRASRTRTRASWPPRPPPTAPRSPCPCSLR